MDMVKRFIVKNNLYLTITLINTVRVMDADLNV